MVLLKTLRFYLKYGRKRYMSDDFKKFMREFYSPLQHYRLVGILKSLKALLTPWKYHEKDRS